MRSRTPPGELLLLAALLTFVAGLCLQPIVETDLFFRLRVGQEILARGGLLERNLFSFTAPDHPDLDLAWAFEVALAWLYRLGGFPAIAAGKTIWIVAVFAGAFAVCRQRGGNPLVTTAVLAVAALVMKDRLVERPHIVSFGGEVVILAAMAWTGRPLSGQRMKLCVFAASLILWANAHAGIFVGTFMLVLTALATAAATGRPAGHWVTAAIFPCLPDGARASPDGARASAIVRRALVLAAFTVLAACLTPTGPRGIVRYLWLHLRLPSFHPIDEFRSATWRSDGAFFLWLVAVAATFALLLYRRRRAGAGRPPGVPDALDVLPALGMSALGLASVRFSADATIVSAPLFAALLSELLQPDRRGAPATTLSVWRRWSSPVALAVTVLVLLTATAWPRLSLARGGRPALDVDIDRSALPLDALRFVEAHGVRERMYNDFEFGSYLLFEGYPRYRVFVDPRLPAYPEELHRLLGSFDVDRATWDAAMRRYGVESALLSYAGINRRVAWWDPEQWALIYRASDARVFVRRDPRRRDLIAAREIPATFDFTIEGGAATRPLASKPDASPVSDCEWQRRLGDLVFDLDAGKMARARPHYQQALASVGCLAGPDEAKLAAWMGGLDLAEGHVARALAYLERAVELSPRDAATRANRAIAYERLGRRAEAAADWERIAIQEGGGSALGNAATTRARRLRD